MNLETIIRQFAGRRMLYAYVILLTFQICVISVYFLWWQNDIYSKSDESSVEETMKRYLVYYRPSPIENNVTAAAEYVSNAKYSYSGLINSTIDKGKQLKNAMVRVTCEKVMHPKQLPLSETWHPVDTKNTSFVFSAYREEDSLKIIILGVEMVTIKPHICQLWYKSDNEELTMNTGQAKVVLLRDSHQRKYTIIKIECSLPTTVTPAFVSVVNNRCAAPFHLLRIRTIKLVKTYKYNFTVCLTPLHFQYRKAYELVEWIELNRILGADHFVFYNYSSAVNVGHILSWYSERGLAEVIQWRLPMGVEKAGDSTSDVDIHYFGQVAALNDCLMRSKDTSEYIVNIDLDEFIIPHSNGVYRWKEMLQDIGEGHDSYIFRNTFFRKEWDSDEKDNKHDEYYQLAAKYRLVTILKLHRESKIFPKFLRSKYIVRSKTAEDLGTHFVYRTKTFSQQFIVSPEKALLHHYRNWEINNDTSERIFENIVPRKFGSVLTKNVALLWSTLRHVEMDMSLS